MSVEAAQQALEDGQPQLALQLVRDQMRDGARDAGAYYVGAEALRDMGALERAESWYRRAIELEPGFSAARSGLGSVLFDRLRFAEALQQAHHSIREDDGNPEAYYLRALLRERRADYRGADRDFHRAAQLDPLQFPHPVPLDDITVADTVDAILDLLPSDIRAQLENVVIQLEEVPSAELCADFDPPAAPAELLGLFSGPTSADPVGLDAFSALPPQILLFRRNLQRIAWNRTQLIEELRVTLFHEIGHYLGLDEDDLHARGLG